MWLKLHVLYMCIRNVKTVSGHYDYISLLYHMTLCFKTFGVVHNVEIPKHHGTQYEECLSKWLFSMYFFIIPNCSM